MKKTYKVEELFSDIPDDPANVLFTIPPEVAADAGWKEGDTLSIEMHNGELHIKKISEDEA